MLVLPFLGLDRDAIKAALAQLLPGTTPTQRLETFAQQCGFRTHAAMTAALNAADMQARHDALMASPFGPYVHTQVYAQATKGLNPFDCEDTNGNRAFIKLWLADIAQIDLFDTHNMIDMADLCEGVDIAFEELERHERSLETIYGAAFAEFGKTSTNVKQWLRAVQDRPSLRLWLPPCLRTTPQHTPPKGIPAPSTTPGTQVDSAHIATHTRALHHSAGMGSTLPLLVILALKHASPATHSRATARPRIPEASTILAHAMDALDGPAFLTGMHSPLTSARWAPPGPCRWFYAVAAARTLFPKNPGTLITSVQASTLLCALLALAAHIPPKTPVTATTLARLADVPTSALDAWEKEGQTLITLANVLISSQRSEILAMITPALGEEHGKGAHTQATMLGRATLGIYPGLE